MNLFKRSLLLSLRSLAFPALFVSPFLRLYIYIYLYLLFRNLIRRFPETGTRHSSHRYILKFLVDLVDGGKSVEFEARSRRGILFENVREREKEEEENFARSSRTIRWLGVNGEIKIAESAQVGPMVEPGPNGRGGET